MHHTTESFPAKTGGYPGMLINTIINTVASISWKNTLVYLSFLTHSSLFPGLLWNLEFGFEVEEYQSKSLSNEAIIQEPTINYTYMQHQHWRLHLNHFIRYFVVMDSLKLQNSPLPHNSNFWRLLHSNSCPAPLAKIVSKCTRNTLYLMHCMHYIWIQR